MIAHIVLFEPKSGLTDSEKRGFARNIVVGVRSIGEAVRVNIGRSISVSPGYDRNMGDTTYQFAAVIEFEDRAALIRYLKHPLHHKIGADFWRFCERTVVSEVEMSDVRDDAVVDLLVG